MSTKPTTSIAPPLIGEPPNDAPILTPTLASALLALIVNTDRTRHDESANTEDPCHSDAIA